MIVSASLVWIACAEQESCSAVSRLLLSSTAAYSTRLNTSTRSPVLHQLVMVDISPSSPPLKCLHLFCVAAEGEMDKFLVSG